MEVFQDLVAEACADMSDVAPRAAFPHGEDQGAEERSGAPGRREAGDHHFLSLRRLDLQPIRSPASGRIRAAARFAMRPSRPFRSASAKNFVPSPLRWGLKAISVSRGRIAFNRFLRSRRDCLRKPAAFSNM